MTVAHTEGGSLPPPTYYNPSNDPYLPSSTQSYEDYIGVPQGYQGPVVGYRPLPPGHQPQPIRQEPIYTYGDIARMAGNTAKIAEYQQALWNTGYLTPDDDFQIGLMGEDTVSALQDFWGTANMNGLSDKELYDYITSGKGGSSSSSSSSYYGSGGGSGADYSPYTSTTTTSSVNLSSRAGARAFLVQAMATEMGREPTQKELTKFLRRLNAKEEKSPTVTKTTTTTDPSPSGDSTTTSDSTTKQSKVDAGREAEKYAEQIGGNEANSFQASNFMSVIESMVGL